MYAGKDGTWEQCSAFVEEVKRMYTVTSYNLYPVGAPDKNGKQDWHVDVNYIDEK